MGNYCLASLTNMKAWYQILKQYHLLCSALFIFLWFACLGTLYFFISACFAFLSFPFQFGWSLPPFIHVSSSVFFFLTSTWLNVLISLFLVKLFSIAYFLSHTFFIGFYFFSPADFLVCFCEELKIVFCVEWSLLNTSAADCKVAVSLSASLMQDALALSLSLPVIILFFCGSNQELIYLENTAEVFIFSAKIIPYGDS